MIRNDTRHWSVIGAPLAETRLAGDNGIDMNTRDAGRKRF